MSRDGYFDTVNESPFKRGAKCPHCGLGTLFDEENEIIQREHDGTIVRTKYWTCDVCGTDWEVEEVYESTRVIACVL